jgi:hypothetical protein
MIANGAEHPGLQISKGHFLPEAADIHFGVVVAVRISANDKHMISAVAPHVRQRHRLGVK